MELEFKPTAVEDINYWKRSGNKAIQAKIDQLLQAVAIDPLNGKGKPEALEANLAGYYARKITYAHRMVYSIDQSTETVVIHSLLKHYMQDDLFDLYQTNQAASMLEL